MKVQPEALVILIHIILVVVYAIFIFLRISQLRKEYIIPLCVIPIFGILFALTVELILLTGKQGIKKPDIEAQGLGDDILWATLKSSHEKSDLVPLEEAVLIDEVNIRRKSMLETLYTDPSRYLGILNTAKYSEDIEISHYATTTIAKAQKEFQLAIQRNAVEMERHPSDLKVVDAYIDILGRYIQSGLLEEGLLKNIRMEYARALDRKLVISQDDKDALVEKLRNEIELHDFNSAIDTSRLLREYWPDDEQTWIETLRVCVEGDDEVELRKTIDEIQERDILWTEQGREQIKPWRKMTTA
jgi:hypothetical protein